MAKKVYSVRLRDDLTTWIRQEAKRENRTFTNKVEEILQKEMDYRT